MLLRSFPLSRPGQTAHPLVCFPGTGCSVSSSARGFGIRGFSDLLGLGLRVFAGVVNLQA